MKGARWLPSFLACPSRPTYPLQTPSTRAKRRQGGSQCMRAPPSLSPISAHFPSVMFIFLYVISTISCGDTQFSPSFDWQISWSEDQCRRSISLTTSSCQGNNNKDLKNDWSRAKRLILFPNKPRETLRFNGNKINCFLKWFVIQLEIIKSNCNGQHSQVTELCYPLTS